MNERKVLKLPTKNVPEPAPMPNIPTGPEPSMDGPSMDSEQPIGEEPEVETPEFDGDAKPDDGGNPDKKEIQKLAGELSQALGVYNKSQKEPDTELNKYVGGMINKQIGKALDASDRNSIAKKLEPEGEPQEPEAGEEETTEELPPMKESRQSGIDNLVNEIVNNILSQEKNKTVSRKDAKIQNKHVTQDNPFISKR